MYWRTDTMKMMWVKNLFFCNLWPLARPTRKLPLTWYSRSSTLLPNNPVYFFLTQTILIFAVCEWVHQEFWDHDPGRQAEPTQAAKETPQVCHNRDIRVSTQNNIWSWGYGEDDLVVSRHSIQFWLQVPVNSNHLVVMILTNYCYFSYMQLQFINFNVVLVL